MSYVRFEHTPTISELLCLQGFIGRQYKKERLLSDENFAYLNSGKSAFRVVLSYLSKQGVIKNKMSPVLVPQWIGAAVYQTMIEECFPVFKPADDAKVIVPYHQYGFPQDMGKVLDYAQSIGAVIVEDCAHAPNSYWNGRRLGTIGDFGIFSYSKLTFCQTLGGVCYQDTGFSEYLNGLLLSKNYSLISSVMGGFKGLDELLLSRGYKDTQRVIYRFRKMLYSVYGDVVLPRKRSISLLESKSEFEVARRKEIYSNYYQEFQSLGLVEHLERDNICPYVVPLRVKNSQASLLIRRLNEIGVESCVRRFDVNRFFIEPNFVDCVLLPVHSGISPDLEGRIIGAVRSVVSAGV